jgi:ureidoglycolate hydrolase
MPCSALNHSAGSISQCTHDPCAPPSALLEQHSHEVEGYRPLVDFESWRVAILNYSPDLLPERITRLQRHNETDEVFVLLQGRCILFVGEGDEANIHRIYAADLNPGQIYNVKRAVWHSHTLSHDAKVLVVENRDTTYDNSPFLALQPQQCQEILRLTQSLWSEPTKG